MKSLSSWFYITAFYLSKFFYINLFYNINIFTICLSLFSTNILKLALSIQITVCRTELKIENGKLKIKGRLRSELYINLIKRNRREQSWLFRKVRLNLAERSRAFPTLRFCKVQIQSGAGVPPTIIIYYFLFLICYLNGIKNQREIRDKR